MDIRIVRCEQCGYKLVPPYPDDYFCPNCKRFSANLFDAINRNKRRKVESKDFEIQPIRNIDGTERRNKSKIPKKIKFYGIVSKERIPLYYNNAKYKYILELTSNLDFIATSTLSGTLDKMLIYLENEDEGDEKQIIARFFEKNGIIHILIGNFSDKDSDWIFNPVSRFLNDLLRKNNIDIRKELSNLEKHKISINIDKFLNHIEEEYELKVEFKNPNFDYIDEWLRLDYFGLSFKSVGVISLLLDNENNLKFNEQQQFESSSEKLEFRESVLTAKFEAISAIIRGNMKGYPRWISIKAGFQKYRYLSFKKLENQFFYYCITEGNIEKLESLESFLDGPIKKAVSQKFTGSLKIFNELKKKIRTLIEGIPGRKFY